MKLNIGCGTDYRDGFVNIDGSDVLPKVDRIIDIANESLLKHFPCNSCDYILANDIIEHHFHWEAVQLLKDFLQILKHSGEIEVRVPDTSRIIRCLFLPMKKKITMLYGGQDLAQGNDSMMDASRKLNPQYFCHKYGWTRKSMKSTLETIGFSDVSCKGAGPNFITYAKKL